MLLWILAIGIALVGLAAAGVGLRGRRVNDHPICRGCGFDLVGLEGPRARQGADEGSTDLSAGQSREGGTGLNAGQGRRCPECGRELSRRRAVRVGARRRRRVALVAGALLAVTGAAWTGALAWGRAQSFDWNTVKPTWLLMVQTRQPTADIADAGMQELAKRLEAGKLAPETVETIAERILKSQGDLDLPWHGSWGRFIETADAEGALNAEQRALYVRQALAGVIAPHEITYRNGSIEWGLRMIGMRGAEGHNDRFRARVQIESVMIGGEALDVQFQTYPGIGHGGSRTMTRVESVDLPAGTFDVMLRGRVDVGEGMTILREDAEPIASWPLTLETTLEVGANPITWIDDPDLAPILHEGHPQGPTVRRKLEGGVRIDGFLHFRSVPVGMVADVFVRDGEREWEVGRLKLPQGGARGVGITSTETLADFDAERVDIILRTVEDEEPDASWPAEVWRGEVVFEDVPLQWAGGRP